VYELRPRTAGDAAFLKRAHHEGLRAAIEATWGWDQAFQDDYIATWLTDGSSQIITVAGEAAGYLEIEDQDDVVELVNIVLVRDFQGRGVGTLVVGDVIEAAARRGRAVRLGVLQANPDAQRLYTRLGFQVIDNTPPRTIMRRPVPQVP
jgi:ribosomal protein S18 acetylase RimI-like enzyme